MKNQTAYLTAAQKIEIRDSPMPRPGAGEVMIEVRHVGICGSDIMFYEDPNVGGRMQTKLPVVLGHESAGVVAAVGPGVEDLKPGDRVALEPGIPCGHCRWCLSGKYNLCPDVNFMACSPWERAALSRYIVHPAAFCFKLPENVSTLEGALVEPLAVGLHAASRAGAGLGQTAVILGSGCIGLMTLLACKAMGVSRVVMADLFDNRLEMAAHFGADLTVNTSREDLRQKLMAFTEGLAADLVFETAGSPKTAEMTPGLVMRGGKIVLVGNIHEKVHYDFFALNSKEVDVLSVFRYRNIYPMAISAIAAGSIKVAPIATDLFPFEQTAQAFDVAKNQKQTALKVVVEF